MAILTPREVLERIVATSVFMENASDVDASKCVSVYPSLKGDGSRIKVGTRVKFGGILYRSRNDLWDTVQNTPTNNPNAWEKILYRQGYRVIEGEITAEHPVTFGERIWFNDKLYESIYAGANVWTPERYPEGYTALK